MKTYNKDPDSVLDYSFDWTNWLGKDAISTSSWDIPTDLTEVLSDVQDNSITTVWLSGGVKGERYLVTNHIITQAGREDDRSFIIEMTNK